MFFRFYELNEYLKTQDLRDVRVIKKVEGMFESCAAEDVKFCKKVSDISAALESRAYRKTQVLKKLLNSFWTEILFRAPFNESVVMGVLKDPQFIAFLLKSKLMKRYIKMDYKTKDDFKLRLYVAILSFDRYKKNKWSNEEKDCK